MELLLENHEFTTLDINECLSISGGVDWATINNVGVVAICAVAVAAGAATGGVPGAIAVANQVWQPATLSIIALTLK